MPGTFSDDDQIAAAIAENPAGAVIAIKANCGQGACTGIEAAVCPAPTPSKALRWYREDYRCLKKAGEVAGGTTCTYVQGCIDSLVAGGAK